MFTFSDITTIATKKHMAAALYTKIVDKLEAPIPSKTNGHFTTTLGEELLLVDNENQDGFKFAIDDQSFMEVYAANNVEFAIFPTFYSSHVGMRLAIYDLVLMTEVPEYKGTAILEGLSKEQVDQLAEAMAWLNEAYAKGL